MLEHANKTLSGRRATAVYALLTRPDDLWEDLYQNPVGDDAWQKAPVQQMLQALECDPGPIDGILGKRTRRAVERFQASKGLPETGSLNPGTRTELFLAYMDRLCRDSRDAPFQVEPKRFLGAGQDDGGKADYQGCGELNPVQRLSQAEHDRLRGKPLRRALQNAPNRRVAIFLFQPGLRISPEQWPCPRATEGPAACQKRLWSDADQRRTFQDHRRSYEEHQDTYACRFYERIGCWPSTRLPVHGRHACNARTFALTATGVSETIGRRSMRRRGWWCRCAPWTTAAFHEDDGVQAAC